MQSLHVNDVLLPATSDESEIKFSSEFPLSEKFSIRIGGVLEEDISGSVEALRGKGLTTVCGLGEIRGVFITF